jgi:hypothetical protein
MTGGRRRRREAVRGVVALERSLWRLGCWKRVRRVGAWCALTAIVVIAAVLFSVLVLQQGGVQ